MLLPNLEQGEYLDLVQVPLYFAVGFKRFSPHEKHVNRKYPNDVLLILVSGTLRFIEDGVPVELHAGEYYIQYRQLSQKGEQESDATYFYLDFLGNRTAQGKNALPRRGIYDADNVLPLCETLRAMNFENCAYTKRALAFHDLLRCLSPRRIAQPAIRHAVMELCDYFDSHYTEQLPLETVARRFNYSTDYLIRFFKNQYGVTPHQYITFLRVSHAKQLLEEGEQTMLAVALACGYTDYSSFYRAFTRVTGVTPGEWVKQNEQG